MRPEHGGPQRRPHAGHVAQRRLLAAAAAAAVPTKYCVEHALEVDGEPRDVARARVGASLLGAVAVPPLVVGEHAATRSEQPRDDGVEGAPRGRPAVDEDDGGGRRAWRGGR